VRPAAIKKKIATKSTKGTKDTKGSGGILLFIFTFVPFVLFVAIFFFMAAGCTSKLLLS